MTYSEIHWSIQSGIPLLAFMQLLPLFGAVLMLMLHDTRKVVISGLGIGIAELLLAILMLHWFDQDSYAMQFAERLDILGPFSYHAAVDGVSVIFMLLTAFMILLVLLYGPVRGLRPYRNLYASLFAVEASLMALFATVNLMWFTVLSIVQLGLIGYPLWRWAISPEKDFALIRFYQFMGTAVLLLLAGTLMLGWNYAHETGGQWSFDLFELSRIPVAESLQSVIFFMLFYGMAVRTPLFPLHGWLPLIARHGNIAVAPTLLLGLKIGIYGLIRYVLPLMPEAVWQWHNFVVGFALVGVMYAALLAMLQTNMRQLLAFAVVSHTSLIVIGIFTLNHIAFQGSVLLCVTLGLAATTIAITNGMIYRRTKSTSLNKVCGLFDHIPLIGMTFLIAGLAIIGMPGTPGFDAAHLIFEASIHRFGALLTIAAALGNVVAAGFLLWAFQRAFLTPCPAETKQKTISKASAAEIFLVGMVVLVLLGAGFYSTPWLELIDLSLQGVSGLYIEGITQ